MTIEEIRSVIATEQYDFLRSDPHLGSNIILLALGGSHAYGTNVESSDLDVRGCALNKKEEILTNQKFEQFINEETDTTIYSFNKLVSLLVNCNPNTIEMLGCKPEHYLYVSDIGKQLLDNSHMFLSKRAAYSFGGYANQQLRRLDNKAVRTVEQSKREQHILNSIQNAFVTFPERYFNFPMDNIKLYIDKSPREEFDTEIYMDIALSHYPLRDYKAMWAEMNNIVKDYSKIGKKNKPVVKREKIAKHMVHTPRLYMMCLDILEREQIVTYREKEHDLLMNIRNGKFLDEHDQPIPEFYEMVDEYERRLNYAKENTSLPEQPDYKKINEFLCEVNEKVVKGEL